MKLPRKVSRVEFSEGCTVPFSAGGVTTGLVAEKHKVVLTLVDIGVHCISVDGKFEALYPHGVIKAAILLPDDEPIRVQRSSGVSAKAVSAGAVA